MKEFKSCQILCSRWLNAFQTTVWLPLQGQAAQKESHLAGLLYSPQHKGKNILRNISNTSQHGVISQQTWILGNNAVITWNLLWHWRLRFEETSNFLASYATVSFTKNDAIWFTTRANSMLWRTDENCWSYHSLKSNQTPSYFRIRSCITSAAQTADCVRITRDILTMRGKMESCWMLK